MNARQRSDDDTTISSLVTEIIDGTLENGGAACSKLEVNSATCAQLMTHLFHFPPQHILTRDWLNDVFRPRVVVLVVIFVLNLNRLWQQKVASPGLRLSDRHLTDFRTELIPVILHSFNISF